MWFDFESISPIGMSYAHSLGRALALAQSFEANCKYVLLIANLDQEAGEGRITSLRDVSSYSEKLEQSFKLGGAVTQFKEKHKIDDAEIEVLRKGTAARNYIAHRAAHPLLMGSKSTVEIREELETYKVQVSFLAGAENLISQWSFMIQEKSEPPPRILAAFPHDVTNWVLAVLYGEMCGSPTQSA